MMSIPEQKIAWDKAEQEVKQFNSKEKYVSNFENEGTLNEGLNKLYSKKQIKLKIYSMIQNNQYNYNFINSLQKALVIMRDGKIHNLLCEYATGTSCSCWCSEKYHGMFGQHLQSKVITN